MCRPSCLGSCRWSQTVTDPVAVRGPHISESQAVTGGRKAGVPLAGPGGAPHLRMSAGGPRSRGLRGSHSRHSTTLDLSSALS